MNIVTLWHHDPHPAQARLADYLATAQFPAGAAFVWGLVSATEAALEPTRQVLLGQGHSVDVLRFEPPADPIRDDHAKHQRVTDLYNQLVPLLREPTALFIEDDVIPCDADGALRLGGLLDASPESCAMVAGAYRSRPRPMGACAVTDQYLFWDKLPVGPATHTIPVRWAGAGLTIFRTSALHSVMPFRFQIDAKARKGWDIFVAEDFRRLGFTMLLAPGLRAEHCCPEVIAYCAKHGCQIA
jgi:GNAT superfamily N-acetyltransferase